MKVGDRLEFSDGLQLLKNNFSYKWRFFLSATYFFK